MATYNHNNPVLSSAALNLKLESYMKESLQPVEGTNIYEQLFYKEDIPAVDPKTGRKWIKTFTVSKPQGPGGFAEFTEEMFKGMSTPGLMGLMTPNEQEYTLATKFRVASIGRSYADKLNDNKNFYEAVKEAEFGSHIAAQKQEEIKKAIFENGIKTYANGKATEDDVTAADTLKWSELETLVASVEDYEVQVTDNRERVSSAFLNTVTSVISTAKGETALSEANVIDYAAFQEAQKAFEASGLRTYKWSTPRYLVHGATPADAYNSSDINGELSISTPADYKELFKKNNNWGGAMVVFVSKNGYRQLWDDEEFQKLVAVSGYQNEQGLSGRFGNKYNNNMKNVMVLGILIVEMGNDYIHGSIASEGIDYGQSVNGSGVRLDAALVATPGYNFITESSAFGVRTTAKATGEVDSIDRLGWQEWMYTLFTWDVQILTPSAFNLLVHASV